jgi:hypothetical protein
MLYKFKSQAAGDLIMLQPNGRQMLEIIGKDASEASGGKGILAPTEMPAAIAALEAAIAKDEQSRRDAVQAALAAGEPAPHFEAISLRQRALPLIDMLRCCAQEDKNIVWGV